MPDQMMSLFEILGQGPEAARNGLGLRDQTRQGDVTLALSIAQKSVQTVSRMRQIEKLYDVLPQAQAVADDFTQNAHRIVVRQSKIGSAVSPHEEAEHLLYGETEPAVVTFETPEQKQARINSLASAIGHLDQANDRAMMFYTISEVRAASVKDFFRHAVDKPVKNPPLEHVADPLLEQASALEQLAYYYEYTEKLAIKEQVADEFMKAPEWLPVGLPYTVTFKAYAAQTLAGAAALLKQAEYPELAEQVGDLAQGIVLDQGQRDDTDLRSFTDQFLTNYDAAADTANRMLDPCGARDFAYWQPNETFLAEIEDLTRAGSGQGKTKRIDGPGNQNEPN